MKSGPFSRLWRAGIISSTGDWIAILATLSLAEELAGGGGIVLALTSRILPGLFFAGVESSLFRVFLGLILLGAVILNTYIRRMITGER